MPNGHVSAIRKPLLDTFREIAAMLKADWEAGNQRAENVRRRGQVGGMANAARYRKLAENRPDAAQSKIPPSPALATSLETELRRQLKRNAEMQTAHTSQRLSDGGGAERAAMVTQAAE
jgi:hypothetical protein